MSWALPQASVTWCSVGQEAAGIKVPPPGHWEAFHVDVISLPCLFEPMAHTMSHSTLYGSLKTTGNRHTHTRMHTYKVRSKEFKDKMKDDLRCMTFAHCIIYKGQEKVVVCMITFL